MSSLIIGNLRITDPERLRRIAQTLHDHFGGYAAAAKALDMAPRHFRRMVRGELGHQIRRKTIRRLARLLQGTEQEEEVWRAILGLDGERVLRAHVEWLNREMRPLVDSRGRATELYGKARRLLDTIRGIPKYGKVFDHFEEMVSRRGHHPTESSRVHLARLRAITPLLAAERSSGMERTWVELDESGDLSAYLRHSLARELILLKRPHDVERARVVGLQIEGARHRGKKKRR